MVLRMQHGGVPVPSVSIILHNPANLEGILSIEKVLPGVKQVAVFDTSFHQTLPATILL